MYANTLARTDNCNLTVDVEEAHAGGFPPVRKALDQSVANSDHFNSFQNFGLTGTSASVTDRQSAVQQRVECSRPTIYSNNSL